MSHIKILGTTRAGVIGNDLPLPVKLLPDQQKMPTRIIPFALQVPRAGEHGPVLAQLSQIHNLKGEFPHGFAVGVPALVPVEGSLPTVSNPASSAKKQAVGLPVRLYKGFHISGVPMFGLGGQMTLNLFQVGIGGLSR